MAEAGGREESTVAFWANFADIYATVEHFNFQASLTTFTMAESKKPGARILEVGCGAGYATSFVAHSMLSRAEQPVLVAVDFTPEFVALTKRRFEEQSDYTQIAGNALQVDTESNFTEEGSAVDLDSIVASSGAFRKLVYGCRASGTRLPFPDGWFSGYVSNLVLQLIDDPVAMIREAFRVLKPGSKACFTVWGRRENSLLFTLMDYARERLARQRGEEPPAPERQQCFDIAENIGEWTEEFKRAGFAQVKSWYQPCNMAARSAEEWISRPPGIALRGEKDDALRQAAMEAFDEISGTGAPEMRTLEVMVIVAFKD